MWKWGKYGWVSPASLMYTAAWRKYYYPDIDCCKIWASDETNKPIPGGYSIRSEDESISIFMSMIRTNTEFPERTKNIFFMIR